MFKNYLYNSILILLIMGCKAIPNKIDTVAIVTSLNYKGDIVIFFSQETEQGDIRLKDGKHFFYVQDDGIFFTKLPIGEGYIENYIQLNNKLKRVYYESPMTLRNANDTSYQVIGGSYRGIINHTKKGESKTIQFLPFQAELASKLKKGWEIEDSKIDSIYTNRTIELKK